MKKQLALYCHWPYCLSKCPYCDFYSMPCRAFDEASFLNRYRAEIEALPAKREITSIFFGGGTPSLMPLTLTEGILNAVYTRFSVARDVEISMEANPDAIDQEKMMAFKKLGINRLSLGVQALSDEALHFLGRRHTAETARRRIKEASAVFDIVSIDLMYARPGQTVRMWEAELKEALSFNLPHYSLYQLTIEDKTPFASRSLTMPDDETARDLFLRTINQMDQAGVPLYEVSNFARPGFECRHNQAYWRSQDYAGIGPSAHGRIGLTATENPRDVAAWLAGERFETELTPLEKEEERLLMGLRQKEGIEIKGLSTTAIQSAVQKDWIVRKGNRICPTDDGLVMLNTLILDLWPQDPA